MIKVFSATLLVLLAVGGANCQCQDSDEDVRESLYAAFGRQMAGPWNCVSWPGWQNWKAGMSCNGNNPMDYTSHALYYVGTNGRPESLFLNSRDYMGNSPGPYAQVSQTYDLSTTCLDSLKGILDYIKIKRDPTLGPGPPATPAPISQPPTPTPAPNSQPPTQAPLTCPNSSRDITYKKKNDEEITTTCRKIGRGKARKMKKLCSKVPAVAEQCLGICKTKPQCKCVNNPWEFEMFGKKKLTCSSLEDLSEKKRKRKCKKKTIKMNCPLVCEKECMDSATAAKLVI